MRSPGLGKLGGKIVSFLRFQVESLGRDTETVQLNVNADVGLNNIYK